MDAMVTARMSQGKKEAGAQVLKELGLTASQIINELYDRLIATRRSPFEPTQEQTFEERLREAQEWVDNFPYVELSDEWQNISVKEARAMRIADRYGIVFEDDGE